MKVFVFVKEIGRFCFGGRKSEVCLPRVWRRKKCFVELNEWGSVLAFCLALPWWVDRVGRGRVFRRAESFNHLGDTCRLNLNLVSSDQASFIHVQSSWMVEGRNSSSVEVLTLLTAAWMIVVDIHGYGGSTVHSLQVAIPPVPAMAQLRAERLSTCNTQRPQASLCFFFYLQVYVESQSAMH